MVDKKLFGVKITAGCCDKQKKGKKSSNELVGRDIQLHSALK